MLHRRARSFARCLILALTLGGARSAAAGAAELNVEDRPYVFPPYAGLERADRYFSRATYESTIADRRFTMRRLVYQSDSLRVAAYLYTPRVRAAHRLPTVVFVRGSYVVGDVGWQYVPLFRRLADAGFAVIAPLLRGSDGTAGRDEMGGADLDDLMRCVALAQATSVCDTARLYLYGESRGGMMVFQALRDGFPARAAATVGAFTDLDSLFAAEPERYAKIVPAIWPDFAAQHDAIAARRSALRWAERLHVPLLLMHGGADGDVSPNQTLRLSERLHALGRPFELHVYANDGHALKTNAEDRDRRVAAWFHAHAPR